MNIVNETGQEIISKASVGNYHGMTGIFLESRSGNKNAGTARNPDYNEGLKLILTRLVARGYTKLNIWVASTNMQNYDLKECQILQDGQDAYYLSSLSDLNEVRRDIGRKQTAIKPNKSSKGGNPTKRIFISVEGNDETLRSLILGTTHLSQISSEEMNHHELINLDEDKRTSVLLAIKVRRGQNAFRKALLKAYKCKCAITECEVEEVLEAAHILSYKGEHTNVVSNGLLLRADLHTLFDLGLINVDANYRVIVSPKLSNSEYWQYNDLKLKVIPLAQNEYPLVKALKSRCASRSGD